MFSELSPSPPKNHPSHGPTPTAFGVWSAPLLVPGVCEVGCIPIASTTTSIYSPDPTLIPKYLHCGGSAYCTAISIHLGGGWGGVESLGLRRNPCSRLPTVLRAPAYHI